MTASALAAVALLALLVAGAGLARRHRARHPAEGELRVAGRVHLSRDAGVALLRADGARLLVGWGQEGVRLVADLGPERAP